MSTEDRTSWALLALLAVAQFMVVLDITIVNVALPSIGAGLGFFTAASLACGLAPSPGFLIAARAVQGCGAALLTPSALAIVTSTYTGAQRVTALSLWGAIASGGVGVGVLLGG